MSTESVTALRQRTIEDMKAVRRGSEAIARHGHGRGHPPVPAASFGDRREFSAASASARVRPPDWPVVAPQIFSPNHRPGSFTPAPAPIL
jgi:hypothetical protein